MSREAPGYRRVCAWVTGHNVFTSAMLSLFMAALSRSLGREAGDSTFCHPNKCTFKTAAGASVVCTDMAALGPMVCEHVCVQY